MIWEVAKREITIRSRTKSYRIITAFILLLAIAGPIAVKLWPGSDDARELAIGVVQDENFSADFEATAPLVFGNDYDLDIVPVEQSEVDELLAQDAFEVAVEPGPTLVWKSSAEPEVGLLIGASLQQSALVGRAGEQGMTPTELGELLAPIDLGERFVEDQGETSDIVITMAFIGLLMAFAMPQVFGQLAMMSVIEEKASRVIEVLLSHIRPRTLLAGKVVGISLLSVAQMVLVCGGMLASLLLTTDVDIPNSAYLFLPVLVICLLLGLVLYITLFSLVGSLISRQEDAAQVMMPVFLPIMGGYFVGTNAAFGNASSLLARILTYVPFTAPMLLPVRVARDAVSTPMMLVSLAGMALTVVLLIRLAGRAYEFTLLRTGSRIGWGELVQLLRSS